MHMLWLQCWLLRNRKKMCNVWYMWCSQSHAWNIIYLLWMTRVCTNRPVGYFWQLMVWQPSTHFCFPLFPIAPLCPPPSLIWLSSPSCSVPFGHKGTRGGPFRLISTLWCKLCHPALCLALSLHHTSGDAVLGHYMFQLSQHFLHWELWAVGCQREDVWEL